MQSKVFTKEEVLAKFHDGQTIMGILETRNGSGTFVIEFNFEDYIRAASAFYIDSNLMDDLMAFRMTIEVECIRLAAKNGTEEEVRELERLALEHRDIYMNCFW